MTAVRWTSTPFITAIAALLTLAPLAKADPLTVNDVQFISALAEVQWHTSSPTTTVRLAHDVCNGISMQGLTPRQSANSGTWWVVPPGSAGAFTFVKTAIRFYCPQYLPAVDW